MTTNIHQELLNTQEENLELKKVITKLEAKISELEKTILDLQSRQQNVVMPISVDMKLNE